MSDPREMPDEVFVAVRPDPAGGWGGPPYPQLCWNGEKDAVRYVPAAALDALADERDRLRDWNAAMVVKAASGGVLDGYRAMGAKLARYEGALEAIAASPMDGSRHRLRDIARAALTEGDET